VAKPARSSGLGRPRLFDDQTERRLILDAAVVVMRRNGYANMSVNDILAEAGLSTSSFYRHFDSKEALAEALIRRDGRSARHSLDDAIADAAGSLEALIAWLDAVLDLFYDRRKSARVAVMSSSAILSSRRVTEVVAEMRWALAEPLVEVLRRGHESGAFHSPDPVGDAATMFALASAVANMPKARRRSRSAARAQVVRFAWPALHIEEPPPTRSRGEPSPVACQQHTA
jgi:AcrR family transcriptional regulator